MNSLWCESRPQALGKRPSSGGCRVTLKEPRPALIPEPRRTRQPVGISTSCGLGRRKPDAAQAAMDRIKILL